MAVGWRDEDGSALQVVAVFGLLDTQRGAPRQDLGHQAAVPRVEVLDDGDRGGKIRRQRREDLAQCPQPSGGGRDGDGVEVVRACGRYHFWGPLPPVGCCAGPSPTGS